MNYRCANGDPGSEQFSGGFPGEAARGKFWSVILAGGNGDRIGELIRNWLGRSVPKQYCAFTGKRSMLQHTLLRADALGPRERQFVLIAEAHRREAQSQLAERWPNGVIVQPANRDTLPGIFLPLTHVYARDPKATVAIFPSDHFIYPEIEFRTVMERAIEAVEALPDTLMLVGAPAHGLELEYGWIYPGGKILESATHPVHSVNRFLEKPERCRAVEAMARGAFWNTMIIVVKAHTLWQLGCDYFPDIMRLFMQLHAVIGTSREEETVKAIYEIMPAHNFSSGLLAQAAHKIGVVPMTDVLWCDWGRKERILETLRRIGKKPNFPLAPATSLKPVKHKAEIIPLRRDDYTATAPAEMRTGSL
ncbi:MAG TPA: sugar phosphate nucleotidyltransferase [Acidobacteriota bacterium]|nr:sugar phosphate nucleotidyltransferase [Acidobacteriota bacterium]